MAALGSRRSCLKRRCGRRSRQVEFDGKRYERYLERRNGEVVFDGDLSQDPELADLFAFLLESNEARRAVRRGDELRELIMRPIDTDEIEADISTLEAEKRDLDDRLERLEQLDSELQGSSRRNGNSRTRSKRRPRKSPTSRTNSRRSISMSGEPRPESGDRIGVRRPPDGADGTRVYRIRSRDRTGEPRRTRAERDEAEGELEAFDDDDHESPDRLEGRIQELRARKRSLDTTVSELQSVIRFSENGSQTTGSSWISGTTSRGGGRRRHHGTAPRGRRRRLLDVARRSVATGSSRRSSDCDRPPGPTRGTKRVAGTDRRPLLASEGASRANAATRRDRNAAVGDR